MLAPGSRDTEIATASPLRAADDHVGIRGALDDLGDGAERDRAGRPARDRERAERVEIGGLRVEHDRQRLVLVEHVTGGDQLIGGLELRGELRRREVERRELRRLDQDLDLAHAPALELDAADAEHAHERGAHDALGDVAQPARVDGACPARRRG